MDAFANLPSWAIVLIAVFAAVVLIALNVGWLLQAKAMLEAQKKKRRE